MSSTGRNVEGHERHPDDLYVTPAWVTRAILPHVSLGDSPLDPCAGDGAILRELHRAFASGIEIDEARSELARRYYSCETADALSGDGWGGPSSVIMNPPFKLALEFVERAIREVQPGGDVVALLRLAFLESRGRAAFHRDNPADVFVLAQRPSFAHGKTDSCAYAWFRWGRRARPRGRIMVLDGGPGRLSLPKACSA